VSPIHLGRRWAIRALTLALTTAALVAPTAVAPPAARANPAGTGVVINEVYTMGAAFGEPRAFVELFNPTHRSIDLTDWHLQTFWRAGDSGPPSANSQAVLTGSIAPYSYYLVEAANLFGSALPTPDFQAPTLNLFRDGSTVVFLSGFEGGGDFDVIDRLGYGPSPWSFEGASSANGATNARFSRGACGSDTDNNGADFTEGGTATPKNSSTVEVSCAPPCVGKSITIAGSGTIVGTPGDDVILGSDGDDTIDGGGGNDTVCALSGTDIVDAGAGNDAIYGGTGNDALTAGTGTDDLSGGAGDDVLAAGNTDTDGDVLKGNGGVDQITGGPGLDSLYGGPEGDTVRGGANNDILVGGPGADALHGEAGNDRVSGGLDDDSLTGGDGDDSLFGGPGTDTLDGGAGTNLVRQ
jgi:Ca2+-binding RTX toxin-like protein